MVDTFAWISLASWDEDITKLDFVGDRYMVRGHAQRRKDVVTSYDIVEPGSGWNMGANSEIPDANGNGLKNKRPVPTHAHPGALNEFCKLDYTMVIEWDAFDLWSSTQEYQFYDITPPATYSDTATSGFNAPENGPMVPTLFSGFFQKQLGPEADFNTAYTNVFEVNAAAEWREAKTTVTYDQEDYDYWITGYPGRFQHGSGSYYLCPLGGTYGWKGIPYEMLPDLMEYQHTQWFCNITGYYVGWGADPVDDPDPDCHPPDCRRFVPTTLYGREDVPNPYADAGYPLPDGYENSMLFGGSAKYGYYVRRAKYNYLGYENGPYGYGKGHDPFRIGLFARARVLNPDGSYSHDIGAPSVGDYQPGAGTLVGSDAWVPTDFDPLFVGGRPKNPLNVFPVDSGAIDGGWFWPELPWTDCPFGRSRRNPTSLWWRVKRGRPDAIVPMTYASADNWSADTTIYQSLRMFPNSQLVQLPRVDDDENYLDPIDIFTGGFPINATGRNRMAITVSGKYMACAINGSDVAITEAPAGFQIPRPRDAVGPNENGADVRYYSPYDINTGVGHLFQFPFCGGRKIRCIWLYRKKKKVGALKALSRVRPLVPADSPYWKTR